MILIPNERLSGRRVSSGFTKYPLYARYMELFVSLVLFNHCYSSGLGRYAVKITYFKGVCNNS